MGTLAADSITRHKPVMASFTAYAAEVMLTVSQR